MTRNTIRTAACLALSVLLHAASRAQFAEPVQLPQQDPTIFFYSFTPMHIDGDGLIDAFFTAEWSIGICMNNGSGGYLPPVVLDNLSPNFSAQTFDMNGDGAIDIVVRVEEPDGNYFFQRLNLGDGTFAPWDTLMHVVLPDGQGFNFLHCQDVNGDGLGDIVVRWSQNFPSARTWRYYLNAGGFNPDEFGYNGSDLIDADFADLDGTGPVDWLFTYNSGMLVGYFDGNEVIINASINYQFQQTYLTTADLTGDGFPDIITYGPNDARLYVNNGSGQFLQAPILLDIVLSDMSDFGDVDGDGDLDVVTYLFDTNRPIRWYENDGTGSSFTLQDVPPQELMEHCFPCGQNWTVDMRLADLDSDGDLDVVNNGFDLYRNNGDGTFAGWEYLLPGNIHFVHEFHIDLNGDGLADIFERSPHYGGTRFRRNLGNGAFDAPMLGPRAWAGPGNIIAFPQVAKLDADLLPDLYFVSEDQGSFAWSKNLGGFQFLDPVLAIVGSGSSRGLVGVADFDGDGDLDVVLRSFFPTVIFAYLNDGDGNFSEENLVYGPDPVLDDYGLTLRDLDNDGAAEVTPDMFTMFGTFVLWNNGGGALSSPLPIELEPGIMPHTPLVFYDMDGDGLQDVWSTFPNDGQPEVRFSWHRNLGGNAWGPRQLVCVPYQSMENSYSASPVQILDPDGDGDGDLIFRLSISGEFENSSVYAYAENLGGAAFSPPSILLNEWPIGFFDVQPILDTRPPYELLYYTDGPGENESNWMFSHTNSDAYQIKGVVFVDANGDGVRGPDEQALAFVPSANTTLLSAVLTSSTGEYTIPAGIGTHQVSAPSSVPLQGWASTTPTSYSVQLTPEAPVAQEIDFGYQPAGQMANAELHIEPGQGPCGGVQPVWITIHNSGNSILYGSVEVEVSELFGSVLSANDPGASINGTTISWNIGALGYFQSKTLAITIPNPDVDFMGETLEVSAAATLVDEHGNPAGAQAHRDWVLACAYDPNDKQVEPVGYGVHGAIPHDTEHLDYTIRFQNTGTATAYHVLITDTLSDLLDHSRIEVLGASHQISLARITNEGLLDVRFYNILLPDSTTDFAGSQGFITFRMPMLAGAPVPAVVTNAADIFFDYNPPIHTNTVLNTLVDCALFGPVVSQPWGDVLETAPGDGHQWYLNGQPIPGATSSSLAIDQLGSYTVEVLSPYGCLATSEAFDVITLSNSSPLGEGILVVPNPFGDVLYVVAGAGVTSAGFIELHDIHGRLVLAERATDSRIQRIDRNGLPSGVYLLRIVQDGTVLHSARLVAE